MMQRVCTCGFIAFVLWGSIRQFIPEKYEAFDSVPADFCGEYVKIFKNQPGDLSSYDSEYELLSIRADQIGIKHGEDELSYYPVQKVHRLSDYDAIIFYGKPYKGQIAEHRRRLSFREHDLLVIDEVFEVGDESQHWRLGTYQTVRDYAAILNRSN